MYTPTGEPRFANPVYISSSPRTFSWLPRLAIPADNSRRVYALWQVIVFAGGGQGGEIFFARSSDGGETFGPVVNLSNSIAGDGKGRLRTERWDNGSLALVAGPGGRIYAAWTEYEGRLWVSRSTDAGASFSEPIHLAGDYARPARAPALAIDRLNRIHLAWSHGGLPAAEIRVATSRDGGQTFGDPRSVPSRGHADAPKLVADSRGGLHIVFAESTQGRSAYRIRYARERHEGAGFAPPRTIAAADGRRSASFPDLAIDSSDRLHLAWRVFPPSEKRSQAIGFATSSDHGRRFAQPEFVGSGKDDRAGFGGGLQGSLMARLAIGAAGTVAMVDSRFAPNLSSSIRLWRSPAAAASSKP